MRIWMILAALFNGAVASAEIGTWSKAGNPAQVNVACVQVWSCGPSSAVIYDAKYQVKTTSPQSTTGVCSAGDGPIDSCNICLSAPPTMKCEWSLVSK